MTEETPANPPKPAKRSFFKKASWQTEGKKPGSDNDPTQMFSRAGESFQAIMAEEQQRRIEKEQRQQKRQQEQEEAKARRKRKSSEEPLSPRSGSSKVSRLETKVRSSPESPSKHNQNHSKPSLAARYDDLVSRPSPKKATSNVVDLGDSDDSDTGHGHPTPPKEIMGAERDDEASQSRDDSEPEQMVPTPKRPEPRELTGPEPVVEVLIVCDMEGMNEQLLIKIPYSMKFGKVRDVWINHQGLTPDVAKTIILTYKNIKVYAYASARSIGITPENIDETGQPMLEATTEARLTEKKAKERKAQAMHSIRLTKEDSDEEIAKAEGPSIRLFLRSKGSPDFKLKVHPDTTFEKIANAFRRSRAIPSEKHITIAYDGDALPPQQMVSDTDIEDTDCLEVYVK